MKPYLKVLFWVLIIFLGISFVAGIALLGALVSPIVVCSVKLYRLGAKRRLLPSKPVSEKAEQVAKVLPLLSKLIAAKEAKKPLDNAANG